MTKLLMVFLSILAGTMGGLAAGGYSLKRQRYFEDLVLLTERLISDIKFSMLPAQSILSAFETTCVALKKNVDEYLIFLRGGQLSLSKGTLKKREAEKVEYFFTRLGTLDYDTQIIELNAQKEEFTLIRNGERERRKRYAGIYVKLGFLSGLAVGILLL